MLNDSQISFISERSCLMTDAVSALVTKINRITATYIGKTCSKIVRYSYEEEIRNAILQVQYEYPQVRDEFDDIRFFVTYSERKLVLLPCNLLTNLIFQRLNNC